MHGYTRRTVLATLGASLGGSLAGCLGDDGGPSPGGETVDDLPVPMLGEAGAPVVVEVFEDFSCPSCRQFESTISPQLIDEYVEPGTIRLGRRDYPFLDDWSWQVASAARAVQDEVDDVAFFDFATAIYDHQGSYDLDVIESVASSTAGAGSAAREAADAMTYRPVLEADKDHGDDLGVTGTPSVTVDGELLDFSGASTLGEWYDHITDAIESRL